MSDEKALIRELLETARAEKRTSLTALEASRICDAYGIPVPSEGFATTAKEAARVAKKVGFPVALKIVSQDILHKTEAGGVIVGLSTAAEVEKAYAGIIKSAKAYKKNTRILGVQVQQMIAKAESQEVIIGAVTDPSFGKVVAFGLGGVFVEVLNDVTFRLAPTTRQEASSMLDGIAASQILRGVRGARGVDRKSLSALIVKVSQLVTDFPEISEIDLNPVVAGPDGVKAVDVRIVVDFAPARPRYRPGQQEILGAMNRIMMPDSVAVIGASSEEGKIGYSVMKNLVDGGYKGAIYPVNPRADEILGKQCYKSVKDIPGDVDIAVFAIPAKFVAQALTEVGEKQIPGAILIPSGFAEIGETELQEEIVAIARKYDVRLMGPNIYGFYSTHKDLCATFCTPYNVKGHVALSSQSGGVGMAIIGFSRSARMGVSAIVGL
ncbi:MAG: acetate--CoA ligase family protein, partial [Dehalococcoidia bacterium]